MQVAYPFAVEKKPESPRRARRRRRLDQLLEENGGAAQVARASGTPKSHISAITNATRGLGDALAAKLEQLYGKPPGWFDEPMEGAQLQAAVTAGATVKTVLTTGPGAVELLTRLGLLIEAAGSAKVETLAPLMGVFVRTPTSSALIQHIASELKPQRPPVESSDLHPPVPSDSPFTLPTK